MGSIKIPRGTLGDETKDARIWFWVFACCAMLTACMFDWEARPIEGSETDSSPGTGTDGYIGTGVDDDSGSGTAQDTDRQTDTMFGTATALDTDSAPCPGGLEFLTSPVYTEKAASSNDGGGQFWDSCPDGQVIVGFRGFTDESVAGGVVGKLQPVCGLPLVHALEGGCEIVIGTGATLPVRGDSGELEWSRICPQNSMIVGFSAQTGADIDCITFSCAPLVITHQGSEHRISRGSAVELERAGVAGGAVKVEAGCASEMIATGVNMRAEAGFPLRAISLGCQEPSLEQ